MLQDNAVGQNKSHRIVVPLIALMALAAIVVVILSNGRAVQPTKTQENILSNTVTAKKLTGASLQQVQLGRGVAADSTAYGPFRISRGGFYSVLKASGGQENAPVVAQFSYGVALDASSQWYFIAYNSPADSIYYIKNLMYGKYLTTETGALTIETRTAAQGYKTTPWVVMGATRRYADPRTVRGINNAIVHICDVTSSTSSHGCINFAGTASASQTVGLATFGFPGKEGFLVLQ